MRFWWVNQKQTYRQEVPGGYLWSPRRKTNGQRNPYYEFMREVSPGDVVFSFASALIKAIGIVGSHAYEAPKPLEFGQAGAYWETIGWRVDVRFVELRSPIRPADYMDVLTPLLPRRYAPLRENGAGLQNMYLTEISPGFAAALIDLLGAEARALVTGQRVADEPQLSQGIGISQWEEHEAQRILTDPSISVTTKESLVLARRGQGVFKDRVRAIERACRITRVDRLEHLRASHCKPWRDATNEERLDGENGLLLTPNADHLFDRGFISFENSGQVIISPVAHQESLGRLGIDTHRPPNVGTFSQRQRHYLDFHRDYVLLKSKVVL